MQIGFRIIYDSITGGLIKVQGEMQGNILERESLNGTTYVDLPYGSYYTEFKTSNLVGVNVETKEPIFEPKEVDLDSIKASKIIDIKQACQEIIIAGFDSTIKYGESHHYSLTDYARENLKDQEDKLRAGTILNALWHYDGQIQHDVWSKEDYLSLCFEKDTFVLSTRLYSDSLEKKVANATTKEEIEAVYWGIELSSEELNYNQSLVASMQIQVV